MKSSKKIKSLHSLIGVVRKLKKESKRIVFTNGCFDIIHPGHIKVFKEAKKKGDILIVGVNSDKSIKTIKGPKRPILNQKARTYIVSSFEPVDYVVLFNEPTPFRLIKEIKPEIIVKGGDWRMNNIVGRNIARKVARIKPLKGYSTTSIINKIAKLYND
ncbi:MAG: hypothetical protein B1H08_03950 [Candidatus Omnitrophica bacterium 4484_171]|nr:MAG: hypothetical protein B1H08_03950 [Candidatus Omnitrophica bacterium 4484_171]